MTVHRIYLEDTETTAPPTQLLGLSLVGSQLFLSIEQYEERFNSHESHIIVGTPRSEDHDHAYAHRAAISVDLDVLARALEVLSHAESQHSDFGGSAF